MLLDTIYPCRHDDVSENSPDTWTYFRISTVTGLGVEKAVEGSTIQVCRIKWPTFEDIGPATDSPDLVAFESAYENVNKVLLKQWGINREKCIFIGVRDRKG